MYKMMTAREVIDTLFEMPDGNQNLDFTFDDIDTYPEVEPCGWYGIKLTKLFDEWDKVLAIGYWGGGSTVVYDIYNRVDNSDNDESVKEFCVDQLQYFMNMWCDSTGACEKICVEITQQNDL